MIVREKRNLSVARISQIAEIMKAIAHPVRLQVLEALELKEPLSVTEIQQSIELEVEQSLLSHHLIKLKDKGVLKCEKQGMHMYYSLVDRHILSIFDCMENCELK